MKSAKERRFHDDKSSSYSLPNDMQEYERLRTQHQAVIALMHNEPIHAPIDNFSPKKIVDVGCGINADMTYLLADRFPNAKVYGVDLSDVPTPNGKPANVEFIKSNMYEIPNDSRVGEGNVDFVYSRFLADGMDDWDRYVKLITKLLAPGGWVELHDFPELTWWNGRGEVISDSWKWRQEFQKVFDERGVVHTKLRDICRLMQTNGLVSAEERLYHLPWQPTPGREETIPWAEYAPGGIGETFTNSIRRLWPGNDIRGWREELENEIKETVGSPGDKVYQVVVAWARKPE